VNDKILITVNANQGNIHMWNGYVLNSTGYYGAFTNGGFSWAIAGNTSSTISDMATTKSAIAVGAYASKISFTNVSSGTYSYSSYVSKGNITPFSSRGPSVDNRIKPDITGPGLSIASSVNSYDATYKSTGSNYQYVVSNYYDAQKTRTYSYAMMSGTSMSSPAVSGITALLLEADPFLDPHSIKNLYSQTAIKDGYTGTIPAGGSNIWGGGKINALRAIQNQLLSIQVPSLSGNIKDCILSPNPGTGKFVLEFSNEGSNEIFVEVFNNLGQILKNEKGFAHNGNNQFNFDLSGIPSGIYFTRLTSGKRMAIFKTALQ
jgi:minor extracellular serine protease Vpr